MQGMRYADIIIDIAVQALDRTFQYRIPETLEGRVIPGSMVNVPFGKGDSHRKGYVISLSDEPSIDEDRIKDIADLITDSKLVESQLVQLAAWMSQNYGSTMAAALKVVFPVKKLVKNKEKSYLHIAGDTRLIEERLSFYERKHQVARLRLLRELFEQKEIPKDIVTAKLNVSGAVIKALKDQGVCIEDTRRVYRNTAEYETGRFRGYDLTDDQTRVIDGIISDFDSGNRSPSLIHGVTGAGKTEVYMALAEEVIKRGFQVIILIPEIALTYQTVMRFYNRFGDRVTTMHSRLSAGERFDQFERAKNGEIDIVIGPRSALFAPFSRLGLIVIDEEHEGSYKSEQTPKYHARETAIERARLSKAANGAAVVLGSATPSVDAYYKALNGDYRLYELKNRVAGGELPKAYVVDLRSELMKGNRTTFSELLIDRIRDRLNKKEQIMLFLNRRGYAGFVSCRKCGFVYRCPHCDVSLSLHRGGRLKCHYCGYEQPNKKECPECGSKFIGAMKAGTEAIETAVKKMFPEAVTLRMDMDTTREKDGHEKILQAFANQEADILIGTQMIVKGHDFSNVTLVGVLAADLSLHAGDYRAGERTFQLLTQAAGRAGRGQKAGEVVIQTYSPDNPHVIAAAAQDYASFYEQEAGYRELMGYPPASHMVAVLFEAPTQKKAEEIAEAISTPVRDLSVKLFKNDKTMLSVIGPAPAGIAYINDIHRQVVYLKCKDYNALVDARIMMDKAFKDLELGSNIRMQFDFDPLNGY